MSVKILTRNDDGLILEVSISFETAMLNGKLCIEQVLNEAGSIASGELLKRFDTDGGAIQMRPTKLTSVDQIAKTYQTPYGEIRVNSHFYQTEQGGATL